MSPCDFIFVSASASIIASPVVDDECLHHSKDLAVTEPVSNACALTTQFEADGQKVEVEWSDLHPVPVSARSP